MCLSFTALSTDQPGRALTVAADWPPAVGPVSVKIM